MLDALLDNYAAALHDFETATTVYASDAAFALCTEARLAISDEYARMMDKAADCENEAFSLRMAVQMALDYLEVIAKRHDGEGAGIASLLREHLQLQGEECQTKSTDA